MKEIDTRGFHIVIMFVILLMIFTVFSWKSCSSDSTRMIKIDYAQSAFMTSVRKSKMVII
jgi:hypothetical protein